MGFGKKVVSLRLIDCFPLALSKLLQGYTLYISITFFIAFSLYDLGLRHLQDNLQVNKPPSEFPHLVLHFLLQVINAGDHVINGKKVDPKKAKARHGKIFVGGLKPELTDDEIKNFFNQFGNIVEVEMPFDKTKNQRKGFCFITFEQEFVVTELLKTPKQSISGHEVDVKKATPKPDAMGMMRGGMRGGMRGRGGGMRGRGRGWGNNWGQGGYNYGQGGYGGGYGGYGEFYYSVP